MEDVLDDPQTALAGISNFLEIENTPSLMNLTFLGEPVQGHFTTAQNGGEKILSKDRTLYRETGLTEAEKRWFTYDVDLFVDYYPDIETELDRTPTVGFLERSYQQYLEFRCAGEESLQALQKFETEFMELQTLQP